MQNQAAEQSSGNGVRGGAPKRSNLGKPEYAAAVAAVVLGIAGAGGWWWQARQAAAERQECIQLLTRLGNECRRRESPQCRDNWTPLCPICPTTLESDVNACIKRMRIQKEAAKAFGVE
jgi:hypothetical protein